MNSENVEVKCKSFPVFDLQRIKYENLAQQFVHEFTTNKIKSKSEFYKKNKIAHKTLDKYLILLKAN